MKGTEIDEKLLEELIPSSVMDEARRLGLEVAPLTKRITRDEYTPALVSLLSNMLVWSGSRVFLKLHGVGTNEWRILSALAIHPAATASHLVEILGMNKSIASKSIVSLHERDLIHQLEGRRSAKHLFLTTQGRLVHDDLLPIALERQKIIHSRLSSVEIKQLNEMLVRMLEAAEELQEFDLSLLEQNESQK